MSFSSDIAKAAERYKVGLDQVAEHSLLQLSRAVVLATPRDEGVAKNNWTAEIDSIPDGTNDSVESDSAVIGKIEQKTNKAAGKVFYLVNNLPYIRALEYGLYGSGPKTSGGFSNQAKSGMVRLSIENYPIFIKNAIDDLTT